MYKDQILPAFISLLLVIFTCDLSKLQTESEYRFLQEYTSMKDYIKSISRNENPVYPDIKISISINENEKVYNYLDDKDTLFRIMLLIHEAKIYRYINNSEGDIKIKYISAENKFETIVSKRMYKESLPLRLLVKLLNENTK